MTDGGTKLFVCCGRSGPVGLRTSDDWLLTHWGAECDLMPGVWLVSCPDLKPGYKEFKLVSGSDTYLEWEPGPYRNKHMSVSGGPQVVLAVWADDNATVVDLPNSCDGHEGFPDTPPRSPLTTTPYSVTCQPGDSFICLKGQKIPLLWSETKRSYTAKIAVPGKVTSLKVAMALQEGGQDKVRTMETKCFTGADNGDKSSTQERGC